MKHAEHSKSLKSGEMTTPWGCSGSAWSVWSGQGEKPPHRDARGQLVWAGVAFNLIIL